MQELEKTSGAVSNSGRKGVEDSQPEAEDDSTNDEAPPPPIPGLRKGKIQSEPGRLQNGHAQRAVDGDVTSSDGTPLVSPDTSRPSSPASHLLTAKNGPGGRTSRRARKAVTGSPLLSRETSESKIKVTGKKKGRRWDDNGYMEDDDDDAVLDYSAPIAEGSDSDVLGTAPAPVTDASWSKRTGKGEVVLKDLDDEMDAILSSAATKQATATTSTNGIVTSGIGAISGLFRNVVGGKTLVKEDLVKPLKGMEDHLVKKNVAREAAVRLCDAVSADLLGSKTASFQSIDSKLRDAMERALTHILTPTSSLDLLRAIQANAEKNRRAAPGTPRRPYVISIVGVNGVGKSTTLAKLAFLLLHNNYRVLVVGGDTFRSGAVEQLRVHVRNLQSLISSSSDPSTLGKIDLYERGYGKDPAHIARDAVALASAEGAEGFDVVLIDTAGRRHNDTRLMSSLEGFARLANPDKIFMVGEALVGSDSVAQARHFNASFGPGRGLDGFIVSKCDTVGEMVGTIVSMVHATGVPVVAVGVGQHYGDLRTLRVGWATNLLMQ